MIKVGLIGFGFIGKVHYSCYNNLPNVKVISIFDEDIERFKDKRIYRQ